MLARRRWLGWATLPLLLPAAVQAEVINVTEAQLLALHMPTDGVTLTVPEVADTGSSVPLSAAVVAPAGLAVTAIEVMLPANPFTRALKINLVEPLPRFSFTTRLRLGGSQNVWVVATLSDGSQRAANAPTQVTSSACYDAS